MKRLMIAAAALIATAAASAQSYYTYGGYGYDAYPNYGYGSYGPYSTQIGGSTIYSQCPISVYTIGEPVVSPNLPYAYGSFFYGQSFREWQHASGRRHSR